MVPPATVSAVAGVHHRQARFGGENRGLDYQAEGGQPSESGERDDLPRECKVSSDADAA